MTLARQVGTYATPQLRQCLAERHDAVELAAAALGIPLRVVTVLLAAAQVATSDLQVPARVRIDPHVRVGRRNGEATNPIEGALVADQPAARTLVAEPLAPANPADSGTRVVGVDQACAPGCLPGDTLRCGWIGWGGFRHRRTLPSAVSTARKDRTRQAFRFSRVERSPSAPACVAPRAMPRTPPPATEPPRCRTARPAGAPAPGRR